MVVALDHGWLEGAQALVAGGGDGIAILVVGDSGVTSLAKREPSPPRGIMIVIGVTSDMVNVRPPSARRHSRETKKLPT